MGERDGQGERDEPAGGLTAQERGDTIGRGRRFAIRLVVAVVIVAGLGATVAVSNGVPARVSAFLGAIGSGASGLLPQTPDAAPEAAPVATDGSADVAAAGEGAVVAGADPQDSPSPGPISSPGPSPIPSATAAAVSGDDSFIQAMHDIESTMRPSSTLAPYPIDDDERRQSELVQANDARWALITRGGVLDPGSADTVVVLGARTGAYTFADLVALGAVTRVDDRTVLMDKTVFVARGAELDLDGAGQTLRMASGAGGFAPLVVWGGVLRLTGAEGAPLSVTSWDSEAGTADTDVRDGRAYIRVHEGVVSTDYADFADLGFFSGRTGGFALTGSSIVGASGTIAHSSFSGLHIGLYLATALNTAISDSTVRDSARQGIEIGPGSFGTSITGSTVIGSASNGVDVRQGAGDVSIEGSTLTRNGAYGLRFDGSPRADGENSAGYSVENAWGLDVKDSTLSANASGGAWVSTVGSVVIAGNRVDQKTVGLYLRDSQSEVTGNTVAVDAGNGIVFEGAHTSARAEGNTISGAGPSAIAQRDGADDVTAVANNDSGWTERWEVLLWIEAHPLALLWALLLIIPVVGIAFVFYRVRRQRRIRDLVESATIALAQGEKQKWEKARAAAASAPAVKTAGAARSGSAAGAGTAAVSVSVSEPVSGSVSEPMSGSVAGVGSGSGRGSGSANSSPVAPLGPPRGASPRRSLSVTAAAGAAAGAAAVDPRPTSGTASYGRFSSVEELAVAAVLDAGKPIDRVAAALRVPIGSVAGWVAKARRQREQESLRAGGD